MNKEEAFRTFLQEARQSIPANATDLRKSSDGVISKWVNLGFEYPHDLMDNMVYIESSIERIMNEYSSNPVELDKRLLDSYDFHIQSFIDSLNELQLFFDKSGRQLG